MQTFPLESMRKYPPGANLIRECTKDYRIKEINYTIKKGMLVLIPVYGIHHDPEFYQEPEKYIPERFEPEQAKQRDSITFIPFGKTLNFTNINSSLILYLI